MKITCILTSNQVAILDSNNIYYHVDLTELKNNSKAIIKPFNTIQESLESFCLEVIKVKPYIKSIEFNRSTKTELINLIYNELRKEKYNLWLRWIERKTNKELFIMYLDTFYNKTKKGE